MAGELVYDGQMGESGLTLYVFLDQDDPGTADYGKRWNTAGTPAWDAVANLVTHVTDHDVALAESPASSRRYSGDFPATIAAGLHVLVHVMERAGADPALSADRRLASRRCLTLGAGAIRWADQVDVVAVAGHTDAADDMGGLADAIAVVASDVDDIVAALPAGAAIIASQGDVQATRTSRFVADVPGVIERPDTDAIDVPIFLTTYSTTGVNEDADALPTITVASFAGVDRSAALATVVKLSTGRYKVLYHITSSHALEGLVFTWVYTSAGHSITTSRETWVLDTTVPGFGTEDRAALEAIYNKLPSADYLMGASAIDDVGYTTVAAALAFAEIKGVGWTPTTGSLKAIGAKASLIGIAAIGWTSPVTPGGTVETFGGADYLAADNAALPWEIEDYVGPNLNGLAGVLRLQQVALASTSRTAANFEFPITSFAQVLQVVTFSVDVTAAQASALAPSPPAPATQYEYQVYAVLANGHHHLVTSGEWTARKGLDTPV